MGLGRRAPVGPLRHFKENGDFATYVVAERINGRSGLLFGSKCDINRLMSPEQICGEFEKRGYRAISRSATCLRYVRPSKVNVDIIDIQV